MFTDFVKSTKYIQFVLLLFVKFLVKSYAFFVIFLQKFGIINFISIIKNILIFEKNKMNFRQNALNRQKKPSKNYIFYILVIVIILWFSVKYKYDNFPTETEIKESRSIIIKKWDTFSTLGEKIPEFNSIFYKLYIRFNPPSFELKEWSYKNEKILLKQLKVWKKQLH